MHYEAVKKSPKRSETRKATYFSRASLDTSELANKSRGTGIELVGSCIELSRAGCDVVPNGGTYGWGSEESQGGDGSGGDGGEMHFDVLGLEDWSLEIFGSLSCWI